MEIASNRVASIHYTLTNDEGQVIDRSPEAQPLSYLHGAGNIVPGLERALEGKSAGDTFNVDVTPEEGYGQRNDGLIQTVPREAFQGVDSINPGMQFRAQTDNGPLEVTVVEAATTRWPARPCISPLKWRTCARPRSRRSRWATWKCRKPRADFRPRVGSAGRAVVGARRPTRFIRRMPAVGAGIRCQSDSPQRAAMPSSRRRLSRAAAS